MTSRLEKTAAFLNKIAAEDGPGFWNSNWFGLGDQSSAAPFAQPAPALSKQQLIDAVTPWVRSQYDTSASGDWHNAQRSTLQGLAQGSDPALNDALASAEGDSSFRLPENEAPGFMSNYWEALKRGHTGTVAATGGAALLAGVLAYNLLKKKQQAA